MPHLHLSPIGWLTVSSAALLVLLIAVFAWLIWRYRAEERRIGESRTDYEVASWPRDIAHAPTRPQHNGPRLRLAHINVIDRQEPAWPYTHFTTSAHKEATR